MIKHREIKLTAGDYLKESLQKYKEQEEIEDRKDYIDVETGGSLSFLYKAEEMLRDLIIQLENTGTLLQEDNNYAKNNTFKVIQMLQDIQDKIDKTPVEDIFEEF